MKKAFQFSADKLLEPGFASMVRDAGFESVAVNLSGVSFMGEKNWKDQVFRLREVLDENGLDCCQTHLEVYDILLSCEITDDETDELIRRSVEATPLLGARWGAWHPRAGHSFGYARSREFEENRKALLKLLDTAERTGAGIAIENIPVFPDCPQYDFYLSNPKDHLELVDSLPEAYYGICWDTGHANLMSFDQAEVIRSLGKRLKIVHLHTNDKMCDEHEAPGTGTIEWTGVMPAIVSTGFEGAVMLEAHLAAEAVRKNYLRYCCDCARWLEELGKTDTF